MALEWMEALDKKLRELVGTPAPSAYDVDRRLTLREVELANISDPSAEAQVAILTEHWDGYVREAAVAKLGAARSAIAFRVLIGRLNDWVPQVRQSATQACMHFVCVERVNVLLACLDALLDLTRRSRADHGPFLDRVAEVLSRREVRGEVTSGLVHSRGRAARYLLARMLEWQDVDQKELANVAARHRDFTVRAMFIKECEHQEVPDQTALLRELIDDVHPNVRKSALVALWSKSGAITANGDVIARCLIDPSQSVRESALWCAKKMDFDITTFLRQRVADVSLSPRDKIGLMGLIGMTSSKEYLPQIREAFLDRYPALRRAALAAWANVARDTADAPTSAALSDESSKVYKAALRLARKGKVVLSPQQLTAAAATALVQARFARMIALSQQLPFWDRLESLVSSLRHARTPSAQREIVTALVQWQRQQRYDFSNLPPDRQARVRTCIIESDLAETLKRFPDLRFSLVQFGVPQRST